MAEPNEYISVTRKNFLSDDNEGRMVEKSFLEIQGTFLVKIRDNTFNGIIRENRIKTYEEYELNNNMIGDLEEPWSDKRVPYQLCDHICEPYRFKNGKTKWPTCSSDIDGFCNGGELPRMVRFGCMTYFQDHKWYDELTEGKLKEEALMRKARFKESWGDSTPEVMKFYAWLKSSFENFHKLYYDVLVKLEECWWKVNAHEMPYLLDGKITARDRMRTPKLKRIMTLRSLINPNLSMLTIKERKHSGPLKNQCYAWQAYRNIFAYGCGMAHEKGKGRVKKAEGKDLAANKSTKLEKYRSSGIMLIMEYLVKISKKARILELKRRHLKIIVLKSYTTYPSRKIR
ncbi:hypothetical protein Tco_0312026 [Tanacetum coccineum]